MSGHNLGYQMSRFLETTQLNDPGDTGTIEMPEGSGFVLEITTAGNGEARTLPNPTDLPLGTSVFITGMGHTGDIEYPASTTIGEYAANESVVCYVSSNGGTKDWNAIVLKKGAT